MLQSLMNAFWLQVTVQVQEAMHTCLELQVNCSINVNAKKSTSNSKRKIHS